jgi:hypothetical protein
MELNRSRNKSRNRRHNKGTICPPQSVHRRAYTRKNGTSVRAACVPQRGDSCRDGEIYRIAHSRKYMEGGIQKVAHIPASCVRRQSLIRPLHKGDLKKYGYSYKAPEQTRRNALLKAITAYGPLTTYHKLDAVAKLSGGQYPKISEIFARDRNWVKSEYSKNGVLSR